ncbi:Uncharacterised protein [Mycobacteroides abscessus subsp. abscessus]|nr:Uncharacterised protein [Mycobacteroides abscessus subsp. abscessus]SLC78144.1 Uncharacterised protein [Mycobacteroides abscessus subsp. massiliense]
MATHARRPSAAPESHSVRDCPSVGGVRESRSVSLKSNSLPRNPRSLNPFAPLVVADVTAAAIRSVNVEGAGTNAGRKTVSS